MKRKFTNIALTILALLIPLTNYAYFIGFAVGISITKIINNKYKMNSTLDIQEDIKILDIKSPAFIHRNFIPQKYTCDGKNVNPPLSIENLPDKSKSLVVIVDDPDAPVRTWTHWLVWNIPPVKRIKEDSIPGTEGITDFREQKYSGPCPPSGLHYYHFKIYALDSLLDLNPKATKHEVEKKMASHILAFGEIIGLYKRNKNNP